MIIWGIEWGDKVEALQAMQAKGMKVPALENMPRYRPDIAIYLRAYFDCATARNERGIIPFGAVSEWARRYEADFAEAWDVIKVADNEVRKWQLSNSKR